MSASMTEKPSDPLEEYDSEREVVRAELSTLVSDFRSLASAELEYLKVRASYSGRLAKWIGIYVALALFAGLSALIALTVGLLLVLSKYLDPEAATLIVTVGCILLAFVAAKLARRQAKQLVFKDDGDDE